MAEPSHRRPIAKFRWRPVQNFDTERAQKGPNFKLAGIGFALCHPGMKALFLFILLYVVLASFSQAAVWRNTAQWSDEYEERYAQWIKEEVNPDFFSDPSRNGADNPYCGIATDCDGAVYAIR